MLTPTTSQRGGVYSAFSCTVSGLFGKTDLRKGCQWIVFCDIVACILLSVSSGLCHVRQSGVRNLVSAIFFGIAAISTAASVWMKSSKVVRIALVVAVIFHAVLALMCVSGFIWQLCNFMDDLLNQYPEFPACWKRQLIIGHCM